jgi:2-methylcitrate dehydratase PrpD
MAQFITQARFEDIPEPAAEMAKLCLLDAVGCAIYGTTRPLGKAITSLVDELGGKPTSRVLGTAIRTNSPHAALANGTLGHSEDFDDMGSGAHQAVLLMPVVLALGEELSLSGRDAVTAYLVGFEITARVSLNMGLDHYAKGWPHLQRRARWAPQLPRPSASGWTSRRPGYALASALPGGEYCRQLRYSDQAISSRQRLPLGDHGCEAGAEGPPIQPDIMGTASATWWLWASRWLSSATWPATWATRSHHGRRQGQRQGHRYQDLGLRRHHATNTGTLRLLKQKPHGRRGQEIFIETTDNPSCMAPNIRWPQSGLEGKFSTWYTAASIAVDGKLDLSSFTDDAANRPAVQEMLKRVTIKQLDDYAGRPNRSLGGEGYWDVNVHLKSGQTLSTRVHDHGDTYRWEQREAVLDKFRMLARAVLPEPKVEEAIKRFMALEQERNVRDVVDLVTKA